MPSLATRAGGRLVVIDGFDLMPSSVPLVPQRRPPTTSPTCPDEGPGDPEIARLMG